MNQQSLRRLLSAQSSFQIAPIRLLQAATENKDRCKSATQTSPNLKPYSQIPAKRSLLPASIELLLAGGAGYLHEHCERRHNELGPIYRDHLGNIEIVFLSDTKHIQTVVANEGQHPHHNVPEAWTYYNEIHNIERGLFFQVGEPWARLRKVFNKVMLADPKSTSRFAKDLFQINDDLLDDWMVQFEDASPESRADCLVPDVKAALCNWSIESTGCMLFGTRMGCVPSPGQSRQLDQRANELVRHVTNMFAETSNFQLVPVRLAHRLNLPSWRRFDRATTGMLRIANQYSAENLARVSGELDSSTSILADMLKVATLSRDEISRSMVDLIIAAADTTSAALQWMLFLLAKNQSIQSRILAEVVGPLEEFSTVEQFRRSVPLLRGFVRESLRLYPTAPFLARTLDRDIVLDGYHIPAGKMLVFSLYTTGRKREYFEDPLEFRPERWLRPTPTATTGESGCPHQSRHAYASLPFGIGARMCVGRRAADLQIITFLASIVKRFHCYTDDDDDIQVKLKMILAPTKPISIKLESR